MRIILVVLGLVVCSFLLLDEKGNDKQKYGLKPNNELAIQLKVIGEENYYSPQAQRRAADRFIKSKSQDTALNLPLTVRHIGPDFIGGRLESLLEHPYNAGELLVSSNSGGVWKTTDDGHTWTAVTGMPLEIRKMVADANSEKIYVATGAYVFGDTQLFVSNDFGDSFEEIPIPTATSRNAFNDMAYISSSQRLLFSAIYHEGFFYTEDEGQTWTSVEKNTVLEDIKVNPYNDTEVMAFETHKKVVKKSVDGGVSWQTAISDWPANKPSRGVFDFGSDGQVYASLGSGDGAVTVGLWKAQSIDHDFDKTSNDLNYLSGQVYHNMAIGVDPKDSQRVLLGGVLLNETKDGGDMIRPISIGNDPGSLRFMSVHPDQTGIHFSHFDDNKIYFINDGGIAVSEDNGISILNRNNNLSATQSYAISISPDGKQVMTGMQDNGTYMSYGERKWRWVTGGDGFSNAWDADYPNIKYTSMQSGRVFRQDGSESVGSLELLDLPYEAQSSVRAFFTHFKLNPANSNDMLLASEDLWITENVRNHPNVDWHLLIDVDELPGHEQAGRVDDMVFDPLVDGRVFAVTNYDAVLMMQRVSDGYQTIEISDRTPFFGKGSIHVTADGGYLVTGFGSYNYQYDSELRILDLSLPQSEWETSWISIKNNLPEVAPHTISSDPNHPNLLYLGTEASLWVTNLFNEDSFDSLQWQMASQKLPMVRVDSLVWHMDDLYIGTYGRGIFKARNAWLEHVGSRFIPTQSKCDIDQTLDAGESGLWVLYFTNTHGHDIKDLLIEIDTGTELPMHFSIDGVNTNLLEFPSISEGESIQVPVHVEYPETMMSCPENMLATFNFYSDGIAHNQRIELDLFQPKGEIKAEFRADGAMESMQSGTMQGRLDWELTQNSGWYAPVSGEDFYFDKYLKTPTFLVNQENSEFKFNLKIRGDNDEGLPFMMVLERSVDGGQWHDVGEMSNHPYNLFTTSIDPSPSALSGWGGEDVDWQQVSVLSEDLDIGQQVAFRFRVMSDDYYSSDPNDGFWIDGIEMKGAYHRLETPCTACQTQQSPQVTPSSGLWFDPSKNGHGLSIYPMDQDNLYYVIFYTYSDDGQPEWYNYFGELKDGQLNASFEAGTLNRYLWDDQNRTFEADAALLDGRLSIDFNAESVAQNTCMGAEGIDESKVALFKWKINDQQAEWCITPIVNEVNKPVDDFGGVWWGGEEENGWGFTFLETTTHLVGITYFYDDVGQPRWSYGESVKDQSGGYQIDMFNYQGYGRAAPFQALIPSAAGYMNLNMKQFLKKLDVDGSVSMELQFNQGAPWQRGEMPIMPFTMGFRKEGL